MLRTTAALLLLGSSALADTFTLSGAFTPNSVETTIHTLSGTFEIVHGKLTAVDISVSGFEPFTTFNPLSQRDTFGRQWLITASLDQAPNYFVNIFMFTDFETYTDGWIGYQSGQFYNGHLVTPTFVQSGLTGTFTCAGECERLPVPGPSAGSLSSLINLWRYYRGQR
jgi:hypothetical protein